MMNFFFIIPNMSVGIIKAIKYKGTYYPVGKCDKTETFVEGVGWIKLRNRKIYDIPPFSGEESEFSGYKEKYGPYVLYAAICGETYSPRQACKYLANSEFLSLCRFGAIGHSDRMTKFRQMQDLQRDVIAKYFDIKPSRHGFALRLKCDKTYWDEFGWLSYLDLSDLLFYPCFNIMGIMPISMAVNPMDDDKKLSQLYKVIRHKELTLAHPLWKKLCECTDEDTHRNLHRTISEDVSTQISAELNTDNEHFPTSVKDRMAYLYGEEITKLYETFLSH